jgi:quercetin dioxygenase-like cupin family protein
MSKKIVIKNHAQGYPHADISEIKTTPFDWKGKGKKEWQHSLHKAGGMELNTFKASPGAAFEGHKAPGDWLGAVVAGSGILYLTDDAGKTRREVPVSNGDVFEFGSDTMHGWLAGPEGMSTIFIVCSK